MRIRTLKPEFWSHPVMARQDDAAKLLAIGLLNYADDEGYFCAEAAMVRAALRPLDEDSSIVRRSIEALVGIDYIEVVLSNSHGQIGRIVSFNDHQRVDRPKESKIKSNWGKKPSSINRRSIVDQSSLEGKGMEQGTGNGILAQFDQFWSAYPRRKAKQDALKAFKSATEPIETLLAGIEAAKASEDWRKEGGKFIPYPATWLRGRRWEDEDAPKIEPERPVNRVLPPEAYQPLNLREMARQTRERLENEEAGL